MNKFLKIIKILVFSLLLYSCEKDVTVQNVWKTYTIKDGLIDNWVHVIAIDKSGNKWFGTSKGLSKFDGHNWINFTENNGLINNYVTSIAIDPFDNIWIGTIAGISKFDGKNWVNFSKADGLIDNSILYLSEPALSV